MINVVGHRYDMRHLHRTLDHIPTNLPRFILLRVEVQERDEQCSLPWTIAL